MLQVKTYLARDSFGGMGLFAGQEIAKGSVITRTTPQSVRYYPAEEYKALPAHERCRIEHFVYPEYEPDEAPPRIGVMLNLDNARYCNHSAQANTTSPQHDPGLSVAARDIKKDEEITCNYGECDPENHIHAMGLTSCKTFLLGATVRSGTNHPQKCTT